MTLRFALGICVVLLTSPALLAQPSGLELTGYLMTGFRTVPTDEVNVFLSDIGTGAAVNGDESVWDRLGMGLGIGLDIDRWMVTAEITGDLAGGGSSGGFGASLSSIGLDLNCAYRLTTGDLELYPLIGIGTRFGELAIGADTSNNTELHGSLGFGVGYEVLRWRLPTSYVSVDLGLQGTYSRGITHSWRGNVRLFDNAPDMSLNGSSLWLLTRLRWGPET